MPESLSAPFTGEFAVPQRERTMIRRFKLLVVCGCLFGVVSNAQAEPVQYVKICDAFGMGYHYIPGTDICWNSSTGHAAVQTVGGVWNSLLPYPEGEWSTNPRPECAPGRMVEIGTFSAADFEFNDWFRMETQPVTPKLKSGEFITKVIMSGGFYDPRIPARHGTNDRNGLCVRSKDPNVIEDLGEESVNPRFGNDGLPIGCVANSRIVNMPAAYIISATAAFPSVDAFFIDDEQTVSGPYTYGSQLVVTTDIFNTHPLEYYDAESDTQKPSAGSLSVSVCVDKGKK